VQPTTGGFESTSFSLTDVGDGVNLLKMKLSWEAGGVKVWGLTTNLKVIDSTGFVNNASVLHNGKVHNVVDVSSAHIHPPTHTHPHPDTHKQRGLITMRHV
jgi:hypothetical protein